MGGRVSSFMSNVWTISQEITIFVHFLKWSTRYKPAFGTLVQPLNWPGSPKQCNVLFLPHLDFGETVSDSLLHTYLDAALQSQFTILTASCAVNTFERRPPSSMADVSGVAGRPAEAEPVPYDLLLGEVCIAKMNIRWVPVINA